MAERGRRSQACLGSSVQGTLWAGRPSPSPGPSPLHGPPWCARRQLERLQASLVSSTAQLKHLQGELGARDGQVAQLQAEVDATRKRMHALQVGSGHMHSAACCKREGD